MWPETVQRRVGVDGARVSAAAARLRSAPRRRVSSLESSLLDARGRSDDRREADKGSDGVAAERKKTKERRGVMCR
ncbi:hypothetical protein EYF80_022733 [Liparis tanakae]|uniref:Uncharacterized protein n=1 Tax=Liparis tanakae TaxID=230148 RepID=A0A4Z2HMW0_9TELE|nr:hypothetical protein EYF80_022733 [Liparis tanakae]